MNVFHGTDAYFGGTSPTAPADLAAATEAPAASDETSAAENTEPAGTAAAAPAAALPAPVDTEKSYKANADDTEDTPCEVGNYAADCSSIDSTNLIDYMDRDDVLFIDTRDFEDYVKKHFRNFEVIPYFAYIWNAEAHTNPDLIHLYGGTTTEPIPMYEESDKILEYLFPKDKTLFIMCQSGGRVRMLMEIMEARGWDMSKVYNIGGLAQYSGSQYRDYMTDTPEFSISGEYSFEDLTPIEP